MIEDFENWHPRWRGGWIEISIKHPHRSTRSIQNHQAKAPYKQTNKHAKPYGHVASNLDFRFRVFPVSPCPFPTRSTAATLSQCAPFSRQSGLDRSQRSVRAARQPLSLPPARDVHEQQAAEHQRKNSTAHWCRRKPVIFHILELSSTARRDGKEEISGE